jgi:hypothetical protein
VDAEKTGRIPKIQKNRMILLYEMKILTNIILSFLTFFLILSSCGGNNQSNVSENNSKSEELTKQKEQEKQILDSINEALSAIQVRIFNHEPLAFDSEGWCIMEDNSVKITEVKDFNKTKSFNCKNGNYIQKLSIEGVFNGVDIQFLDSKDKIVKEFEKFDLQNSVSYSDVNYQPVGQQEQKKKDKFYQDWFEKASKIQLTYKDSVFYTATWKNNGWFVQ